MQLSLAHIIPSHLASRLSGAPSAVWGRELSLPSGSKVLVHAPSGTGKTTLVHILYGLSGSYTGSVNWNLVNPATADDKTLSAFRTSHLSVIFQDMRLFPALTAWENIELKRAQTNTVSEERTAAWMADLGIAEKQNATTGTLSFGEQQRVSIIRALAQPFEWLLMDEPFSHLDTGNREKAAALIAGRVSEQNAGLILADLEHNDYFPYTQILKM